MPRERTKTWPVTVTQLPLTRCLKCGRPIGHKPGEAAIALTRHYQRYHPEMLQAQSGDGPSGG